MVQQLLQNEEIPENAAELYDKAKSEAEEHRRNAENGKKTVRLLEERAASEPETAGKGTRKHRTGKIFYAESDGKAGSRSYKAVDRDSLTPTQQAVARVAEAIARATGLEIRIADFGKGFGGQYMRGSGGVVWPNINAGFDGKHIAAGSLFHELTHWLQEYSPARYAELKRVVIEEMQRDPAKFSAIFNQRAGVQPELTPDAITDEMVANACQTVLADPETVQRIVEKHRSLAEKLRDLILKLADDIRAAFSEIDTRGDFTLYREVRAAENAAEQIREAWLKAFDEAEENLQAEQVTGKKEKAASPKASKQVEASSEASQASKNAAQEDGVKYQYIGEKADNIDRVALARAQEMERNGEGNETIRNETGWFRGIDKKWRYEIDDSGMKWNSAGDIQFRADHPENNEYRELLDKMVNLPELLTKQEQARLLELDGMWSGELSRLIQRVKNGRVRLGDVLQHEELFRNYPWLKDLRVEFADLGSSNGRLIARSDGESVIQINRNNRADPRSTLVHEIQHAIQHYEGFAIGSSPEYWENRLKTGYAEQKKSEEYKKADKEYLRLFDAAPDELKNKIRALNRAKLANDIDLWDKIEAELYDGPYADEFVQIDRADWERRRLFDADREYNAKDLYFNTAGEIEARDAQYRQRWNTEKRKATPPDLGDENTVFADGAGPSYSIKNTRGMTWKKQTDSYFGGKLKSSDSLYLGNSGKYVRGISSSPLYIPTSIVTKAMRPQKGSRSAHAMTENDIRGLEKGIREAPAVIYNPDRNALIYIAQEAEKGGQVVATFDLNNDLFGESAHKATSIHPRESIIPMLEKLGKDAVIYVQNENKFNELAGLQSDNPPKLLARVELVGDSLTDSGTESKGKFQMGRPQNEK